MTDYDEVLDECQRLADYWMNEQEFHDTEVVPVRDEYRVTISHRHSHNSWTEWFDTLDQADDFIKAFFVRPIF